MDEENVQVETVSEETPSVEVTPEVVPEGEPAEQPLTEAQEARIQQMLSQEAEKAREQGKREMQAIKDREVAAAERRAKQAEAETSAYKAGFGNLDEATQQEIETQRIRVENQALKSRAQEEDAAQAQEAYFKRLDDLRNDYLESLGIKPDEKEIDWAEDAKDFIDGWQRFSLSANKIVQGRQKVADDKQKQDLADLEARLRKDLGLDSVDQSQGAGADTGDEKFIEEYNSGERDTPADHARAAKLLQKNR